MVNRQPQPTGLPASVTTLLRVFETQTALAALRDQIDEIERLEIEAADYRGTLSVAQSTMGTIEAKLISQGVEGTNDTTRKANLLLACQQDPLYMRMLDEQTSKQYQLALAQVALERAQRTFTACRLEIEARISSKNLIGAIGELGS